MKATLPLDETPVYHRLTFLTAARYPFMPRQTGTTDTKTLETPNTTYVIKYPLWYAIIIKDYPFLLLVTRNKTR